jgi:hypothetical protein
MRPGDGSVYRAIIPGAMTPEEISQLRRYAFHLREMVAHEERVGSSHMRFPSWTEAKRMLLTWAEI